MTTTAPEVRAVTVSTDGEREFAAFVRARQQSLLHAAILLVGDVSAAQDLVQEALIKLAERWEKVERGADGMLTSFVTSDAGKCRIRSQSC